MIKNILIVVIFLCGQSSLLAQLEVTSLSNLDNLIEELVTQELLGCNVEISNVDYIGNADALGRFTYSNMCSVDFGLDRGMLVTSGLIENAVGPNNNTSSGYDYNLQFENQFVVDYLLNHDVIVDGVDLFDASGVEFNLTTNNDIKLFFEMVYGSEEYMEWISPFYNDAFCFFISEINGDIDPNFDLVPKNIMETGYILNNLNQCEIINKPISAWTIRPYSNSFNSPSINECFYLDNPDGDFCDAIGYDGYTKPMEFSLELMEGAIYRIMIVISDGGADSSAGGLDSGVFIKKNIKNAFSDVDFIWSVSELISNGNNFEYNVSFTNTSNININENIFYEWDFNNDNVIDSNESNPQYIYSDLGLQTVNLNMIDLCTGSTENITHEFWIDSFNNTLTNEDNNDFNIFPNPANHHISINHNLEGEVLVKIFDLSGQLVHTDVQYNSHFSIPISSFKKGIYYVEISNYNNSIIHRKKIIAL